MISGKPAQDSWSGLGRGGGGSRGGGGGGGGGGWGGGGGKSSKDLILSQPVEGMKPWSL